MPLKIFVNTGQTGIRTIEQRRFFMVFGAFWMSGFIFMFGQLVIGITPMPRSGNFAIFDLVTLNFLPPEGCDPIGHSVWAGPKSYYIVPTFAWILSRILWVYVQLLFPLLVLWGIVQLQLYNYGSNVLVLSERAIQRVGMNMLVLFFTGLLVTSVLVPNFASLWGFEQISEEEALTFFKLPCGNTP